MATTITVVTGPPCAGKTTHVADRREPGDLVVDVDALAHALGYPNPHLDHGDLQHPAAIVAFDVRNALLRDAVSNAHYLACHVWIVDTAPPHFMRARYHRAGAQFVNLDPGLKECQRRAAARYPSKAGNVERRRDLLERIAEWYERHQ